MILALMLLAVPADLTLSLHAGAAKIEKIDWPAQAVAAQGPLRAELLPSGNEVLLEPQAKGVAHVFVFTPRQVRVIEAYVDTPPPEKPPPPSCATVKDAACYAQFRAAPQPKMIFEVEGLQAEAKAAQQELSDAGLPGITVAISPWGVKLTGAKDEAEKRKALIAIWPAILGPLRLDQ